jgi:hypothetical protein
MSPHALRGRLAVMLILVYTAPAAFALSFDWPLGEEEVSGVLNTSLSAGAQFRMQDRSSDLVGKTKINPNLCPVAGNGAGTSCQGHLDVANPLHFLLNSFVGEGHGANQVAVDAPGQFSNNNDDGNLNFDRYDLTQAPLKVSSDLTLSYGDYTLFARVLGYYDPVNLDQEDCSPNSQTPNTVSDQRRGIGEPACRPRSAAADKQLGQRVKLLDFNLGGRFEIADHDVSWKIGNQNINWGESTLLVVGSLNTFSPPNVNALFRPAFLELAEVLQPIGAVYLSSTVFGNLNAEVFYQYDWEPAEIPPPGSFLSTIDVGSENARDFLFVDFGKAAEDRDRLGLPDQIMLSAVTETSGTFVLYPEKRARKGGQYGVSLKYYAENLNNGTELGIYYANYHSRLPFASFYAGRESCLQTTPSTGPTKALTDVLVATMDCPGIDSLLVVEAATGLPNRDQSVPPASDAFPADSIAAQLEYPEDIQLFGLSFTTTFGDYSWQGEIAYRPKQPLQVDDTDLAFAALQNIFPRGNGSGDSSDKYDFGIPVVGVVAQLPGARYGVPDFVSGYRGRDVFNNPYAPGEYIRGYEYFRVAQWDLGFTRVFGSTENIFGADQILLLGEIGGVQVFDLPALHELQIEGPGTFTHASAGADGSGADGSPQSNSGVIGPSGIRFNPTQTLDGFVTPSSWGYRLISIVRYENVLPGIGIEETIVWSHDVNGVSPGPGENFAEGRKMAIANTVVRLTTELNVAFTYTWFFGGGKANLLADRDFAQIGVRYQF